MSIIALEQRSYAKRSSFATSCSGFLVYMLDNIASALTMATAVSSRTEFDQHPLLADAKTGFTPIFVGSCPALRFIQITHRVWLLMTLIPFVLLNLQNRIAADKHRLNRENTSHSLYVSTAHNT